MSFDHSISLFLHSLTENSFIASLAVFCGQYLPYIFALMLVGFILYDIRKTKEYIFALLTFTVLFVSRFFALPFIRIIIRRPRPFVFDEAFTPLVSASGFSFPSGHATTFFALATAIYIWNKKIGTIFYIFATMIALGRVFVGVHYMSDVIAGAVLGMFIALFVSRFISLTAK